MNESIYTSEQWAQDGDFKAQPGQEIDAAVYDEMFNALPPRRLPRETAEKALRDHKIPVHAGFLMGEPHSHDDGGALYLAFGKNDYGHGAHYYYLGLSHKEQRIADGEYYYMDCMNAFVNNGLFPAAEFADDAEAIREAANYEATLYKMTFKGGQRISSKELYSPAYY